MVAGGPDEHGGCSARTEHAGRRLPSVQQSLVERWGDRDDTRQLIGGLDDEAISRLAQAGSAWILRELVRRWGDRDDTRQLISRLAQAGSSAADSLLAWFDWVLATAGPSGL